MQNRNYKQAHEYSRLFFLYLLLAKGHQSIKFKVSGTKLKTRKKKNIQSTFTEVPKFSSQEKLSGPFETPNSYSVYTF